MNRTTAETLSMHHPLFFSRRRIGLGAAFLLMLCTLKAQDRLEINEIEVIKHFDARLIEAEKIPSMPTLPEMKDTSGRQYQYQLSVVNPRMTYTPPQIRPLALRPEEPPKAYRGFLRAGYGVPNAILGQLSYLVLDKAPAQLSISADHLSANHKEVELQKYSKTQAAIRGSFAASEHLLLSSELAYQYHPVYFFARKDNDPTSYVDDRRVYKTFTGRVNLSNTEPIGHDIFYSADLDLYDHKDDLATHEKGLDLYVNGEKRFHQALGSAEHAIAIGLQTDFSNLTDSEQERSLNNFLMHPKYTYRNSGWSATGGVKLVAHEKEFEIFPTLQVHVPVSAINATIFAEVEGGLTKNTFYTLSQYNPFIHQRIDEIRNTNYREYGGGVRGTAGKIHYEGKGSFTTIENLALYETDHLDYRKFQPLYDNGNLITIEGTLHGQVHSRVEAGASLNKIFYDLDTEERPWHLPGMQASVYGKYLTEDHKLSVRASLFYENGVPYLNQYNEIDRLKGLFDLSLSADYYIIENIGAFAQINNLLGDKHQRWYRYPSFGLNGVIGIMARI